MDVTGLSADFPPFTSQWHLTKQLPERAAAQELYPEDEESEFESEDEVSYIVLDTAGHIPGSELERMNDIQIMALESETPLVRIGRHIFQGKHKQLIGSEILLAEHAQDDGEPAHSVFAITSSHLTLTPVELIPKGQEVAKSQPKSSRAKTGAPVGRPRGTGKPRGRPRKVVEEVAVSEKVRRKAKKAAPLEPRASTSAVPLDQPEEDAESDDDQEPPNPSALASPDEDVEMSPAFDAPETAVAGQDGDEDFGDDFGVVVEDQ